MYKNKNTEAWRRKEEQNKLETLINTNLSLNLLRKGLSKTLREKKALPKKFVFLLAQVFFFFEKEKVLRKSVSQLTKHLPW